MKKDTLLGIIIPVYNVNSYICECIDSVIELKEVEVIIADDGSKENTDFIIEKYKNYSNFKFFRKNNDNLSSVRNFGLEKAETEYIIFLDGDDFIDIEKMKKILLNDELQ
ncbi:putative glycosyltransferase EpsJ [Fusobacterium necrophorum]|nr:glycosyltransferase family 2 protein [Fusobacterium necrophorum]MBR8734866.1 putative glycosyltransferase EpsJ [Fusobacterium necrophorum]MBR8791033.1 putative glycosyltransferase EpsJ [Fusobacterium necrophorum]